MRARTKARLEAEAKAKLVAEAKPVPDDALKSFKDDLRRLAKPSEPSLHYRIGELVSPAAFDPDRLPAGCIYQNGRITRRRKSDRPEDIPPRILGKSDPETSTAVDRRSHC